MLARLATVCFHRRRRVIAAWLVALVVLSIAGNAIAGEYAAGGRLPGTDSQRAFDLLEEEFPSRAGDTATIVFGDVTNDQELIDAYLTEVAAIDGVAVVEPLRVAPDGQIAIAPITFEDDADVASAAADDIEAAAAGFRAQGLDVEFAGWWFGEFGVPSSELLGLLAAIIVLLVAFGSVLAMGLPIVTALVGIGIALAAVAGITSVLSTPDFTPQVATMIGLGVGIDYALFIVTRYRAALGRLGSPEAATVEAITTAGRAVLFAGCTVMISLLGMLLMGLEFLHGLAVGTSIAVAIAVVAALTLIPALLGFVGHNIDKLSIHRRGHAATVSRWTRWAAFVQRRPWPVALAGLAILVVAALPVFSLRLGTADASNDPAESTTHKAYDLISEGFGPGANGRVLVVTDVSEPGANDVVPTLVEQLRATPGVAFVDEPVTSPSGRVVLVPLVPETGPQDPDTTTLLHHLRDDVVPSAIEGSTARVFIGGITAADIDFAEVMADRMPLFFGAVLTLSFILLLVVFRSVLVPLKAVVMNLLSIGAAYGVMVAVFQWGWLGDIVGVEAGPIEAWAPMMLFAVVFGLSMDYEVFLLSAIREEYQKSGDNAEAVSRGLAATARVITAAALIMVFVFGSFVVGDVRALKLIGLGLAVAVAVDATVVRVVLVPATMELLGNANWWLPRWLDRILPRLDVEGPALPPALEPEPVGAGTQA